QLAELKYVI
nr:RecName: Full=58 kDa cell wall protein [Daucus carota]